MSFNTDTIDKILGYKTIKKRDKIDRLLEIDANQYTTLGVDSTKTEKEEVKKNSRYIYRAISKLNKELGTKFLQFQDKYYLLNLACFCFHTHIPQFAFQI